MSERVQTEQARDQAEKESSLAIAIFCFRPTLCHPCHRFTRGGTDGTALGGSRKEGHAVVPAWIVVTSQERLDEVVAAIDSKRVELAKLQARFRHRVDAPPTAGGGLMVA